MLVKRNASCARKVIAVFTAAVAVAVFAIPTGIFGNGFQAPPPLPTVAPTPVPTVQSLCCIFDNGSQAR